MQTLQLCFYETLAANKCHSMYYQIRSKTFTARISKDKNLLATPELFLGLSIIWWTCRVIPFLNRSKIRIKHSIDLPRCGIDRRTMSVVSRISTDDRWWRLIMWKLQGSCPWHGGARTTVHLLRRISNNFRFTNCSATRYNTSWKNVVMLGSTNIDFHCSGRILPTISYLGFWLYSLFLYNVLHIFLTKEHILRPYVSEPYREKKEEKKDHIVLLYNLSEDK